MIRTDLHSTLKVLDRLDAESIIGDVGLVVLRITEGRSLFHKVISKVFM